MILLQRSLYQSATLRLDSVDLEKDPSIEAAWTEADTDLADFYRIKASDPLRPKAAFEVRQFYADMLKQMEDARDVVHFSVRTRQEERLIGFVHFHRILWVHRSAVLVMGFGERDYRQACLAETLDLCLRFAFNEMNLYRITVDVPEYDQALMETLQAAGFRQEVRLRHMLYRNGRYWDNVLMGLLESEWAGRGEVEG